MNAAAYVRVSSRTQSYELQRTTIERAAETRGDRVRVWFEEKRSAKTIERPELARLREAARKGEIRRLYVFRLDRLARSGIRDTFEVVEDLRRHGVELVTLADGFDLGGPAGEVVLAVLAWAAKMERLAIGERIAAARERAAKAGRRWGRPPRISGKLAEKVLAMREEGATIRDIARAHKVPRSTLGKWLKHTLRFSSRNAPLT